jgi:hypothetical protein
MGAVIISTANGNLDGTGTIGSLLSVSASEDGCIIDTIKIKSQVANIEGMIRLFINDGSNYYLIQEVPVPASTPTAYYTSFSALVHLSLNLNSGYSLGVSTENSEQFSIIASGRNYKNCSCPA